MAFDRLQKLGEERFRLILNRLMDTENHSAQGTARMIQQEWGEFQDVKEATLTQQLNRLRIAAAEGMFGKKIAKKIEEGAAPHIAAIEKVSLSALDRLEELAEWERTRCQDVMAKEKTSPVLVGSLLQATNAVFEQYRDTLKDIQKMRFDMGVDKFAGVIQTARGAALTVTNPDGTVVHKQVYEAVAATEDILEQYGIPKTLTPNAGV